METLLIILVVAFFWFLGHVTGKDKGAVEAIAQREISQLMWDADMVLLGMKKALQEKYGADHYVLGGQEEAFSAYRDEVQASLDDRTFRTIDWDARQAEFLDSFQIDGDPEALVAENRDRLAQMKEIAEEIAEEYMQSPDNLFNRAR